MMFACLSCLSTFVFMYRLSQHSSANYFGQERGKHTFLRQQQSYLAENCKQLVFLNLMFVTWNLSQSVFVYGFTEVSQ